jgi:hypothetical protein
MSEPHFPRVELSGGPHGKNLEFKIDGEIVPKTTRVEIVADVNDVVRIKTYQFVELVTIDLEAIIDKVETHRAIIRINHLGDPFPAPTASAEGASLREAVLAALAIAEHPTESLLDLGTESRGGPAAAIEPPGSM